MGTQVLEPERPQLAATASLPAPPASGPRSPALPEEGPIVGRNRLVQDPVSQQVVG